MRCTIGTAVGLVAAGILVMSFWTEAPPVIPGPARAVAQQAAAPGGAPRPMGEAVKKPGASAIDAKLDSRRVPELNLVEMPLKDVLEFLSDANEVDILVNKRALEDLGIADDAPITLQVKRTAVTARTALELVLEQVSGDLGYTVRDGLVYITQKYDNDEIQVYNVRDLLKGFSSIALTAAGMGAAMPGPAGMPGGFGGGEGGAIGGLGGVGGGMAQTAPATAGEALVRVIESTVFPDTWSSSPVGGSGSLAEFNGLLIVKQSQTVHREIKLLLEMMREVDRQAQAIP